MKRALLVGLLVLVVAGTGGWFLLSHDMTRYCVLVFGPNGDNRIWVNVTGHRIGIARENARGQLIPIGRYAKFDDCRDVDVSEPDSRVRYVIERVSGTIDKSKPRQVLYLTVGINGHLAFRQCCEVELVQERREANTAHFDGPLSVGPSIIMAQPLRNVKWEVNSEIDVAAMIVTTKDERRCWVAVQTQQIETGSQAPTFPAGKHPFMDVQFPPRIEGNSPVNARFSLDRFCCGCLARGTVRIPPDAGVGTAKVTFSFDAWEGVNVQPTTIEIPIIAPQ